MIKIIWLLKVVVGLQAVVEVDGVLAESVEPHASNCATSVFGATAR